MRASDQENVFLPARRSAGLLRCCTFIPLGSAVVFVAISVLSGLTLKPSAVGNRITDYSWAFVSFWFFVAGLWLLLAGLRWLLYVLWPTPLGLSVSDVCLEFRLGPFGRQQLDLARMEARYGFERRDDEDAPLSTEDYLDPDLEMQTRLPTITHPDVSGSVNRLLEKFIAGTEREHVCRLRPLVGQLRN